MFGFMTIPEPCGMWFARPWRTERVSKYFIRENVALKDILF
jgi:hypothetical protein